MKKIFIGNTSNHEILFEVAKNSIINKSKDVICYPIIKDSLKALNIYTRESKKEESTDFSITRFLTPWLAGYRDWVLFIDNDIVCLEDINNLFKLADDKYAVMCVKHDYKPTNRKKLDNQIQTIYPRKNWSSVVLWNCNHPKNKLITPEIVNSESPLYLHRFKWLDDKEIGELPLKWNFLVDWYDIDSNGDPSLLHYTEGGPFFEKYKDCGFCEIWLEEFKNLVGREFTEKDYL